MTPKPSSYDVVIAAFDGPVTLVAAEGEGPRFEPARNALGPGMSAAALEAGSALWIFPARTAEESAAAAALSEHAVDGIGSVTTDFALLDLDAGSLAGHRRTLASTLWPLFSLPENEAERAVTTPNEDDWLAFRTVNNAFAQCVGDYAAPGARVMVRDLELLLVPGMLRDARPDLSISFFTFAPWSAAEALRRLPRPLTEEITNSLAVADDAGFLSGGSVRRFDDAMRALRPGHASPSGFYPLPIDSAEIAAKALSASAQDLVDDLRRATGALRIIARVERAERPANLLDGLTAFRELLTQYPEWRGRVVHRNAVFPGGLDIEEEGSLLSAAAQSAEEINSEFGTPTWRPVEFASEVDYMGSLALLRVADVFVANPTRESMSITTWEDIELSERSAAFVLSEESGVAELFPDHALLVPASDISGTARAMHEALLQPERVRADHLAHMREVVRSSSPTGWFAAQLSGPAHAAAADPDRRTPSWSRAR